MTGISKQRRRGMQKHTGRMPCDNRRDSSGTAASKGTTRALPPQEARKRQGRLHREFQKDHGSVHNMISHCSPAGLQEN